MSDGAKPALARPAVTGFPSIESLRAAHSELLKKYRETGLTDEFVAVIAQFLAQGQASGKFLDGDSQRWAAQNLLDYWTSLVARTGRVQPDLALDEFDPSLAPELQNSQCPYRGLNPFREHDSANFFGREGLLGDLLKKVREECVVFVLGASGSGKSSLVLAGLMPALRAGQIPGSDKWNYSAPISPGSDPLGNLKTPPGSPGVLVIDQFEELFTLSPDPLVRAQFIGRVLDFAGKPESLNRVILTLRADFEEQIALVPELLPYFDHAFRLRSLSAPELRDAIEKPAALIGLKFEEGIVDELIKEVLGQPAGLPLLQFALLKLWAVRERNRITWTGYRKLGNARKALANAADAFYERLIPEDQEECRRILLRLVRPGEGLEVTSNRLRRMDLRGLGALDRTERVLGRLVEESLLRLTPGDTREHDLIEVAHEALVRNWPKLEKWIAEERVALRGRLRLTATAEQWASHGKDPGGLLGGTLLAEASAYPDLNPLETEFVEASRRAVEEEDRQKEQERQRELMQARALAEAETKAARRLRLLAVALAVGFLAVGALLVYAWTKRTEADRAEHVAAARFLAGAAQDEQEKIGGEELGALLAAQSFVLNRDHKGDALSEIDAALRSVLARPYFPRNLFTVKNASSVEALALSPEVNRLAIAQGNDLIVWSKDAKTPVTLSKDTPINAVAFSPSGRALAAAGADGSIFLWRDLGRPRQVLSPAGIDEQAGAPAKLRFSPDGGLLAVLTEGVDIRLIDTTGASAEQYLKGHTNKVTAVAFAVDGSRLVSGGADGAVRLWKHNPDRPAGEWLPTSGVLWKATDGYISALAFAPDAASVAIATSGGQLQVMGVQSPATVLLTAEVGGGIHSLDFDGDRLIAGTEAPGRIWIGQVGRSGSDLLAGHSKGVLFVRLAERGGFYSGSADLPLRSWVKLSAEPARTPPAKTAVGAAMFSDDGHTLALGGDDTDKTITIQTEGKPRYELQGLEAGVTALSFGPGAKILVSGGWDNKVSVWNLTGDSKAGPDFAGVGHSQKISTVAVHPDAKMIASAAYDGTMRLWQVPQTGNQLHLASTANANLEALAFSADGKYLAGVGEKGTACLWNVANPSAAPKCFPKSNGAAGLSAVAFSRGAKNLLATGGEDGAVVVRDPERLRDMYSFSGDGKVMNLVFSADGDTLAVGFYSGAIDLWDASRPESAPIVLTGHSFKVWATGFPASERRLTSVSSDAMLLWGLPDALKSSICQVVGRPLNAGEWAHFLSAHPITEVHACGAGDQAGGN